MTLNAYVAEKRALIYGELSLDHPPSEGDYSSELLKEGKVKGKPQLGTTRFEPESVILEFIYPDSAGSATVLPVRIKTPERILFMPVPEWVIESIWQGEIDGSYHFESEAALLLAEFAKSLDAEGNGAWFGPRQPKRKE